MQDYDDTLDRRRFLEDSVKELDELNKKVAKFLCRKEELTDMIITTLDHDHEGQKTYDYGMWKIEVKTPFVYSLNKKLYESMDINIPKKWNPIKKSVAYSIDKRMIDSVINEAPEDVRDILVDLIDKKPGKASVVIKERTQ